MAWKSSSLALLFHGLGADIGQKYQGLTALDKMEDAAKTERVQMARSNSGLMLVAKSMY